jgi:hypothetical protein
MTGHCNLRKHLHTMAIFTGNPVCRLCKDDEETVFHIVFECKVLARGWFNLLGLTNPGKEIDKNLVNRLLDLINPLKPRIV